jgi:hypothetical protein
MATAPSLDVTKPRHVRQEVRRQAAVARALDAGRNRAMRSTGSNGKFGAAPA